MKIPDEIIKKSSKIKIKYIIQDTNTKINNYVECRCKIWTKNYILFNHNSYDNIFNNDPRVGYSFYNDKKNGLYMTTIINNINIGDDPQMDYLFYDNKENGLYSTTIINKIDIDNDNIIFMDLINCQVKFYLISYKNKK